MITNISSASAILKPQLNKTRYNINEGPIRNIIFARAIDSYIEDYLKERKAAYISNSKNGIKIVCFPDQPQVFWMLIRATQCKGRRAEKALIDKRIDSETLNNIVLPMCTSAYEITFFGEE